jgi:hypothetical protein
VPSLYVANVKVFDNLCNDPRRSYESSDIPSALKRMDNVNVKQMLQESKDKRHISQGFTSSQSGCRTHDIATVFTGNIYWGFTTILYVSGRSTYEN